MNPTPEIVLFFVRLHVLLLHLPIALVVLLALFEALSRSPKYHHAHTSSGIVLAFAVPAVVLTVACGWLLSWSGGYDPHTLSWHKWTGVATASLLIFSALLYRLELRKPYRVCVFSSALVLVAASHFGGSLTHGSDYLVRYAPGPFRRWLAPGGSSPASPAQAGAVSAPTVFSSAVQPVFARNCVPCHGPEKTKGGLRLDTFEAMLKGGENGPAIVLGKPGDSLVLKRIQLPASSDDHMPPPGKPQPTADDIALLQWWLQAGAPTDKAAAELKLPPNISRRLQPDSGEVSKPAMARVVPPMRLEKALPIAARMADELGIVIAPLSQNEPWLQFNAAVAGTNFGDSQLSKLSPLRLSVRWLDLSGTAVTDAGLLQIRQMPNLTRLHLEHTSLTDAGLGALSALENLEYLNLYGTEISDLGLEHLQNLPNLRQLYLWQTKVSLEAATNFAQARTDTAQIARWREEIEQLKTRIQHSRFVLDTGMTMPQEISTNTVPGTNSAAGTNVSAEVTKVSTGPGKPEGSAGKQAGN